MGVDVRGLQLADRRLDDRDRLRRRRVMPVSAQRADPRARAPSSSARVVSLEPRGYYVAARRAARQREDMQDVAVGVVLGQRAAAADLDVVGMGADCQHALLLRWRRAFTALASSSACSTKSVGVAGLNSRPSIRHLTA